MVVVGIHFSMIHCHPRVVQDCRCSDNLVQAQLVGEGYFQGMSESSFWSAEVDLVVGCKYPFRVWDVGFHLSQDAHYIRMELWLLRVLLWMSIHMDLMCQGN